MGMEPPRGIWAIASGLADLEEASLWAEAAAPAVAWSFRLPACGERAALGMARFLRRRTSYFAVHARADWALLSDADAVIAGARSLPPGILAQRFPELPVAASCHALDEIDAAAARGAPFVFFGPIWDTPSKQGILAPRGLEELRAACERSIPVIALGGILEPEQAEACREVGAHGVAVLRAARNLAPFGGPSFADSW